MKGQCVCGQISYEVVGPTKNLYQFLYFRALVRLSSLANH